MITGRSRECEKNEDEIVARNEPIGFGLLGDGKFVTT